MTYNLQIWTKLLLSISLYNFWKKILNFNRQRVFYRLVCKYKIQCFQNYRRSNGFYLKFSPVIDLNKKRLGENFMSNRPLFASQWGFIGILRTGL